MVQESDTGYQKQGGVRRRDQGVLRLARGEVLCKVPGRQRSAQCSHGESTYPKGRTTARRNKGIID